MYDYLMYKILPDLLPDWSKFNADIKGMLLIAALMWEEPTDQAPDWVRIIHNANPETFRQDLPELLNLALASLEDEYERNDL